MGGASLGATVPVSAKDHRQKPIEVRRRNGTTKVYTVQNRVGDTIYPRWFITRGQSGGSSGLPTCRKPNGSWVCGRAKKIIAATAGGRARHPTGVRELKRRKPRAPDTSGRSVGFSPFHRRMKSACWILRTLAKQRMAEMRALLATHRFCDNSLE